LPAFYCLSGNHSLRFGFYFCSDNPSNLNVQITGDITAIPLNRLRINSMSVVSRKVVISVTCIGYRPKRKKTMSDKKYDCSTCPYPRYKDSRKIFCDVCICKILDEKKEKKNKERIDNANG